MTKKDLKKVIVTLTRAFFDDSMMCYFFQDPEDRSRILPRFFNYRVRNGLIDGNIFATSKNIEGVVLLTQSEHKNKSGWLRAIRTGGISLYRIAGSVTVRKMLEVESLVFRKRAECISEPHLYLGSLGVHPDHQKKGLASKLIRSALGMCQSQNILCVLDTQEEDLVQMYKHFGFDVVDSYTLPGADITHWVMSKHP